MKELASVVPPIGRVAMRRRKAGGETNFAFAAILVFLIAPTLPRPSLAKDSARGSAWGGLSVIERGSSTAPKAVILIHGYGSRPDDLVPLAEALAGRVDARFIVPAAPRPFRGGADGRVWFDQHLPDAQAQIRAARSEIDSLIDTLQTHGIDSRQVIVAGFSQGAILSIEMALAGRHPLCGIAVLSGRALGHPAKSYRRLAGLPIFSSHGRSDERVPFQRGNLFMKRARAAGANVHFEAFNGEHEIPASVVTALGDWLAARCH
jgi:phospholipase/carboxylesterase